MLTMTPRITVVDRSVPKGRATTGVTSAAVAMSTRLREKECNQTPLYTNITTTPTITYSYGAAARHTSKPRQGGHPSPTE